MNIDGQSGLEIAPLPRERIGPFLILGVPKDASPELVEARWALCVLWARQGKTQTPLGDVHWARELLRDPDQRLRADVASLNTEIAGDELRRLAHHYHLDTAQPAWKPLDPDPSGLPSADIPNPDEIRSTISAPNVPLELPGIARWLSDFARAPIDPWSIPMPVTAPSEAADE